MNLSQLRFGQFGYNLLLSDIPRQIKIQLGIGWQPAVSPLEGPTYSRRLGTIPNQNDFPSHRQVIEVVASFRRFPQFFSERGLLDTDNRISLNRGDFSKDYGRKNYWDKIFLNESDVDVPHITWMQF